MRPSNNKLFALLAGAGIFMAACSKNVEERVTPTFEPTTTESNGGNWKTLLIGNPESIAIPAPADINSNAYQQELADIKAAQASLSDEEKELINQWKGSGLIKWNEVAREMVAAYNLPPEANPDGTYPVPSATNPGAYPKFPFANPPYASRAYAYLHVALYDALVTCWKYKFQYNRKSPSVNDNSIKALETVQQDLPSYPSEDGVISQVAYRMLKVMFPNDTLKFEQLRDNQQQAKILSGVASPSDVAAGEAIANAVADKVLARYRTDGMGQAVGNPTLWAQLEVDAVAHGTSTPWKSMETPARPPMLPFFGNVKQWLISTAQRDSLRPPPPPAIGSPEYQKALDEVLHYSKNQTSETWRINQFWADGAGTYTPPGHWNEIACNSIAANQFSELRAARALALMNMAIQDAGISCWDAKTYYFYPRPSQMNTAIKTIGLPNFPSYTSGHSTFSGAAATVLGYVFPGEKAKFEAMAQEASLSRIYGAIHYRFDCEAGLKCGNAIGSFAVKLGQNDGAN
ncbi:phosphatase PAP2 family protein [Flavihumibacter rivuli]|uniref:phosphatase PAP2 family protein n=1 Tax=Flavihumibacter rivuli TaxID=2838156 RepID=UPI001BDEA37D|nr:phosphatase PAP2 family protein [Flavihumibacter rivuli]ULQ56199.1 phosphatase PAP2 family protein [Flavihumibacter rivuli]